MPNEKNGEMVINDGNSTKIDELMRKLDELLAKEQERGTQIDALQMLAEKQLKETQEISHKLFAQLQGKELPSASPHSLFFEIKPQ